MTATDHKTTAAHLRARLKAHGIKASINMYASCGIKFIRVATPAARMEFSEAQQRQISLTAKNIGLTFARGAEINIDRCTNPEEFHFVFQP